MISDPAIGSPWLTSESDSVGYQPVIDNSPRRLVIETLALPKNETLIENFETKTKCFLCDLEFDLNIERYGLHQGSTDRFVHRPVRKSLAVKIVKNLLF